MRSTVKKNKSKNLLVPVIKTTNISSNNLPKLDSAIRCIPSHKQKSSKSLTKFYVNSVINQINDVINCVEERGKQIIKNYQIKPEKDCYNLTSLNYLK
jgi:hypothetical protein